ncbi:Bridging integrator 3-like protein [Sarcoptes scabiei]|nr:Bridging integrator 3-like protein [Sarcoptes scabiei]
MSRYLDFNTVEFVKHSRPCIIDSMIFSQTLQIDEKNKGRVRTRKTFTRSIRRSSIVALIVLIQSQLDSMKPNKT